MVKAGAMMIATHPTLRLNRQIVLLGASLALALAVSGCSMSAFKPATASASAALASLAAPSTKPGHVPRASDVPPAPEALGYAEGSLDGLISHYASNYGVPEDLVRRVIVRESNYNPGARNGPYYGLMQISHATAGGMGYHGKPEGLLDAETNLRYAVRYLAGAYVTAGGDYDRSVRYYANGYYYNAKHAGLLEKSGLR
jgi:soluble lytic murein transglycosylase-like protein